MKTKKHKIELEPTEIDFILDVIDHYVRCHKKTYPIASMARVNALTTYLFKKNIKTTYLR